eukprot:m.742593 g.742593  ORF g.742593 m.742593 type:complete len:1300 (-) comp23119_c0_seq3:98-3997(-)
MDSRESNVNDNAVADNLGKMEEDAFAGQMDLIADTATDNTDRAVSMSETMLLTPGQAGEEVHPLHYAASQGNKRAVSNLLHSMSEEDQYYALLNSQDALGRTALTYAAVSGKLGVVSLLIESGADVDAVDDEGRSALLWAIHSDRPKVVAYLLKKNCDPTRIDNDGKTFLHLCMRCKSTKVYNQCVKYVEVDSVKNKVDALHMTPLHWAAYYGTLEHAKLLVRLGADPSLVDLEGKTPLHYAVTTTNVALLKLLLNSVNSGNAAGNIDEIVNAVDQEGRTALHVAVGIGNVSMCEALLAIPGCIVDAQDVHGRTPLHWAVQFGHVAMISKLLQSGGMRQFSKVDLNSWSALHYATFEGYIDCVKELLQYEQVIDSPDVHGQTALMLAVIGGKADVAEVLLNTSTASIDVLDETGNSPLHRAAFDGNTSICRSLIQANANVNVLDESQQTPLMFASEQGHIEIIGLLVDGGASTELVDPDGRNALHIASLAGRSEVCTYLTQRCGMDPNVREEGGRTSLHTAVFSSDRRTTQALVAANADVNEQDGQGISAVHWAASMGAKDCLDVLLDAGAFPNHTEFHEERLTPLDYAVMNGHDDVADRLRAVGGLSIGEVRELAAQHIQSWWTGFQTRITVLGAWQQWLQMQEHGATTLHAVPEEDAAADTAADIPEHNQSQPATDLRKTSSHKQAPTPEVVPIKQGTNSRVTVAKGAMKKEAGAAGASTRKKDGKNDSKSAKTATSPPRKPPVPRFSRKKQPKAAAERDDTNSGARTAVPSASEALAARATTGMDHITNSGDAVASKRTTPASPNADRKPRAKPSGASKADSVEPPRKTGNGFGATQTSVLPAIVGSSPETKTRASPLAAKIRTPPGSPLQAIKRDVRYGRALNAEVGAGTDDPVRRRHDPAPTKAKPAVSPSNRTSLAPAWAAKNRSLRSSPKKPKRHVRLIKNPHHLPSLNYYAQAMDSECPDLIDQGVPMPRAGVDETGMTDGPERTRQTTQPDLTAAPPGVARELLRAKENVSMVTGERRRRNLVRAKIEAAKIIQCAFRAWVAAGRPRPQTNTPSPSLSNGRRERASPAVSKRQPQSHKADNRPFARTGRSRARHVAPRASPSRLPHTSSVHEPYGDVENSRHQIAALTIQLAWRQCLRRKARTRTLPDQQQHHPRTPARLSFVPPRAPLTALSPEVLQVKQAVRQLQQIKIYSHVQPIMQWKPKLQRPKRPPEFKLPSVSITAFNLAFDTYFPPEVKERFRLKNEELLAAADNADDVLSRVITRRKKRTPELVDEARGVPHTLSKIAISV